MATEKGVKLDGSKIPVFKGLLAYFPRACASVAEVSLYGATKKYIWRGWEDVPDAGERYTDALARHLLSYGMGRERDEESGLLELAHIAWNALAILEMKLREMEKDDGTAVD